jgi:hypothetical protein
VLPAASSVELPPIVLTGMFPIAETDKSRPRGHRTDLPSRITRLYGNLARRSWCERQASRGVPDHWTLGTKRAAEITTTFC